MFKYYAKHAGCKVSTSNIPFNLDDIGAFIRNGTKCSTLKLHFVLKEGIKWISNYFGGEYANLHNGTTIYYWDNKSNKITFGGWTSNYWISCVWVISNSINKSMRNDFKKKLEPLEVQNLQDCKPFTDNMDFNGVLINIEYNGIESRQKQMIYYDKLIKTYQ